ncbi:MAG TPA: thioredoxin family protein [Terriglobales bacterium]|nr:thioredoxin family protein [Terriglobales bacterium]
MTNETLEVPRTTPRRRGSSDIIRTVTGGTFSSLVLEAAGPIVVEFMSYGCVHCRAIEPVLEKVAETVKSKEKIFRVNTAVDEELADSYEIQGTPTLIMFLNGKEVGRVEGPQPTVSGVLTAVTQPFES